VLDVLVQRPITRVERNGYAVRSSGMA
jgi:hypothetical protein